MKRLVLALAAATAFTGCYKASIHLKAPQPVTESAAVSNQMHLSLLGVVELSPAVNLDEACAGGTVVIKEQVGFVGGLVNMILGTYIPVLQVMNPTAMCGMATGAAEPATDTKQAAL